MLLDAPFIEDDWRAMMVPVDGSGETQWTQWWQWMAVVAALSPGESGFQPLTAAA